MGTPPPRVSPHVSPCVIPFNTAQIIATVFKTFQLDHIGTWQMTPDSLSGQRLPASLQVLLAMCNHFHLTWKWLMGSSPILTSI